MLKLRVGYVLKEGKQSQFVYELLEKSKASHFYSIEVLIIKNAVEDTTLYSAAKIIDKFKPNSIKKWIEHNTFSLIKKIEKKLINKIQRYRSTNQNHEINSVNIEKLYLTPSTSKNSTISGYSQDDLEKLKEQRLDFIIIANSLVNDSHLLNAMLAVCPDGIMTIHYGDSNSTSISPEGFSEVLNQYPSTAFNIQNITKNSNRVSLFKGNIYTAYLFSMNEINLYQRAHCALHQFLEKVAQSQDHWQIGNIDSKDASFYGYCETPPLNQQLKYIFKSLAHLVRKKSWKLTSKFQRWGIAYQFKDDWENSNLSQSLMVKNPPNRFLADPFIVYKDDAHYCFVEDYDYSTRKGKITVYKVSPNSFIEIGTALEEDFHLSYPFIFEASGALFMCPETHQANEIRLYQCVDFPLQWKLHKVLKTNLSAADTNIFKFNDKWWMLTNIDSLGLDEHHAELHLFYADTFDANEWTPHPLNPIIFDPLMARNGGLLFKNNDIYRVFQQQGFDNYGASMGISKITALSTEHYNEELLYKIPADFFNDLSGAHTYSYQQGLLVLDFKKLEFIKR